MWSGLQFSSEAPDVSGGQRGDPALDGPLASEAQGALAVTIPPVFPPQERAGAAEKGKHQQAHEGGT